MEIRKIEICLAEIERQVEIQEKDLEISGISLSTINKTLENFVEEFRKPEGDSLESLDASKIKDLDEKVRDLAKRIETLYSESENVKDSLLDAKSCYEKFKGISNEVLQAFCLKQNKVADLTEKRFEALSIKTGNVKGIDEASKKASRDESNTLVPQKMTGELKEKLLQERGSDADKLEAVINAYVNNEDFSSKEAEDLAKEAVEFIADPSHRITMRSAVSNRLQKEFNELLKAGNLDAAAEKLKGPRILGWFSQVQIEGLMSELLEKDLVFSALEIKRQLTRDGFWKIAEELFFESAERYLEEEDLELASMARDGIGNSGSNEAVTLDLVVKCLDMNELEEAAFQIGFIGNGKKKIGYALALVEEYLKKGEVGKAVEFSCSFYVSSFQVKYQLLTKIVEGCLSNGDKAGALSVGALCSRCLDRSQVEKIQSMVTAKIKKWKAGKTK